jgi:hypothetical protein
MLGAIAGDIIGSVHEFCGQSSRRASAYRRTIAFFANLRASLDLERFASR